MANWRRRNSLLGGWEVHSPGTVAARLPREISCGSLGAALGAGFGAGLATGGFFAGAGFLGAAGAAKAAHATASITGIPPHTKFFEGIVKSPSWENTTCNTLLRLFKSHLCRPGCYECSAAHVLRIFACFFASGEFFVL